MGTKSLCHDGTHVIEKEGCLEDERGAGGCQRHEGGDGVADAEHRIQGADEGGHFTSSGVQDGIQHVRDRRILPQGDRRDAGNQRDDIQNTVQQSESVAAEEN